ncbi:MAG: hypothetical protein E7K04_05785, partial [Helicobacter sp.]|nr:hypothetical protein [Helicobacter sp.]
MKSITISITLALSLANLTYANASTNARGAMEITEKTSSNCDATCTSCGSSGNCSCCSQACGNEESAFKDIGGIGNVINNFNGGSTNANGVKVSLYKGSDTKARIRTESGCTNMPKGAINITFGNDDSKKPNDDSRIYHIFGSIINNASKICESSCTSTSGSANCSPSNNNNCAKEGSINVSFNATGQIDGNVITSNKGYNFIEFDGKYLGHNGYIKGNVINNGAAYNDIRFHNGGAIYGSVINNSNANYSDVNYLTTQKGSNIISFQGKQSGKIYGDVIINAKGANVVHFGANTDNNTGTKRECANPNQTGYMSDGQDREGGGCGQILGNIISNANASGFNAIGFSGDADITNVINNSQNKALNLIIVRNKEAIGKQKANFIGDFVINGNGRNVAVFHHHHIDIHFKGDMINNASGDNLIVFNGNFLQSVIGSDLINNASGNNIIHFYKGGVYAGTFTRNGSGQNYIISGPRHVSQNAVTNIPFIYSRPDGLILTSIPEIKKSGSEHLKIKTQETSTNLPHVCSSACITNVGSANDTFNTTGSSDNLYIYAHVVQNGCKSTCKDALQPNYNIITLKDPLSDISLSNKQQNISIYQYINVQSTDVGFNKG